MGGLLTKDTLQEVIKNWCNGAGNNKIIKSLLNKEDVAGEIFVYIYYFGNDMISKDEKINGWYEKVNILLQFLPTHTRNWVVFRIRPQPIGEDIDSEVMEKTITICKKYLDARVKYSERMKSI
jgi:hypothetical protein